MKKMSASVWMVFAQAVGFIFAVCVPVIAPSATLVIQGQPVQPTLTAPNTVIGLVQVPVVSISQMQGPNSASAAIFYNVIYEYEGHQYSVQLPQIPGPYLTLQILAPTQLLAEPVVSTRVAPQAVRVVTRPIYVKSIGPTTYMTYPHSRQVRVIYPSTPRFSGGHHHHPKRLAHGGHH